MTKHDPAYCRLAVCSRCDAYGDGYAAGKTAIHRDRAVSILPARPCTPIPKCHRPINLIPQKSIGENQRVLHA